MAMSKGFFGVLFPKETGFVVRMRYLICFGFFAPVCSDASDSACIFAVKEVLREKAIKLIDGVEKYKDFKNEFLTCVWHGDNSADDELHLNVVLEQIKSLKTDLGALFGLARHFHPNDIPDYDSIFSTTPHKIPRLHSAFKFLENI